MVIILIVEGPDGSGKSTLISNIREKYDVPIAERVVSTDAKPLQSLGEWVQNDLDKGNRDIIYDRHRLISNPIYSPILGRASEDIFKDVGWVTWVTERFYHLEPFIIYCLPPLEVVRENCQNTENNQWLMDKVDAIYEAYLAKAAVDISLRPFHTVIWDYTADGREDNPLLGIRNTLRHGLNIKERL